RVPLQDESDVDALELFIFNHHVPECAHPIQQRCAPMDIEYTLQHYSSAAQRCLHCVQRETRQCFRFAGRSRVDWQVHIYDLAMRNGVFSERTAGWLKEFLKRNLGFSKGCCGYSVFVLCPDSTERV